MLELNLTEPAHAEKTDDATGFWRYGHHLILPRGRLFVLLRVVNDNADRAARFLTMLGSLYARRFLI